MTQPLSREIEIEPAHTALLFVDVQKYNCSWEGGEYAQPSAAEKEAGYGYFFRELKQVSASGAALTMKIQAATAFRVGRPSKAVAPNLRTQECALH